jgi:ferrochelatase
MHTLQSLAKQGTNAVHVVCPGFPADCLETLEEIALECKAAYLRAGGREFQFIPGLNDCEEWIHALCAIALENLAGWTDAVWDEDSVAAAGAAARSRALALGAAQ